MANLAGKLFAVECVIGAFTAAEVVAGGAGRRRAVIAVIDLGITLKLPVHFCAGVAGSAGHASLAEMDISFDILMFAKKFGPYPAAVAGGAVTGQRWGGIEDMAVDQAAAD